MRVAKPYSRPQGPVLNINTFIQTRKGYTKGPTPNKYTPHTGKKQLSKAAAGKYKDGIKK